MNISLVIKNTDETEKFALACKDLCLPGSVFALEGNLGSGKTYLTQKIGHVLGIQASITSPTYPLIQEYILGNLSFCHMDWYRLSGEDEVWEIGAHDYFFPPWITFIEWPSKSWNSLPEHAHKLYLTVTESSMRQITIQPASSNIKQTWAEALEKTGFQMDQNNEYTFHP